MDSSDIYWSAEVENLKLQFIQKVKPQLMHGTKTHYSLFALAPQPLLIKLGVLLNDLHNIRVYQKHREPSTWKWQQASTNVTYILNEPKEIKQTAVLILSLSATITHERIKKILGDNVSIWEITIDAPNNDFLKTERLLSDFRQLTRNTLDRIKAHYGCVNLHLFPAMPISASVEFGRIWMPKADMPMVIYDENNSSDGFLKTITIN